MQAPQNQFRQENKDLVSSLRSTQMVSKTIGFVWILVICQVLGAKIDWSGTFDSQITYFVDQIVNNSNSWEVIYSGKDTLTSSSFASWTFENSTSPFSDSSLNQIQLVATGSPSLVSGNISSKAISFTGSNYLSIASPSNYSLLNFSGKPFSFSVWFMLTNYNMASTVCQTWALIGGGFQNGWAWGLFVTQSVIFFEVCSTNSAPGCSKIIYWNYYNKNQSIPLNTWFHAAGSFNASSMSFWVNGVLVGTLNPGNGNIWDNSAAPFYVAIRSCGSSMHFFQGIMDDIRLYNTVIDRSLVLQNYYYNYNKAFVDLNHMVVGSSYLFRLRRVHPTTGWVSTSNISASYSGSWKFLGQTSGQNCYVDTTLNPSACNF
jgi:hypothetical protein